MANIASIVLVGVRIIHSPSSVLIVVMADVHYFSLFPVTITKNSRVGTLKRKEIYFAYVSRECKVQSWAVTSGKGTLRGHGMVDGTT